MRFRKQDISSLINIKQSESNSGWRLSYSADDRSLQEEALPLEKTNNLNFLVIFIGSLSF